MAATTGCANGLCENTATKRIGTQKHQRGQEVGAAGMPDLYHIQRTMPPHGVRSQRVRSQLEYYTQIELRRHPSQRRITDPL